MKLEQREINLFNSPYAAPRLLVPPLIKTFENYDKILQNSSIKFSKNSSYLCYCTFYKLWTGRKFKQFRKKIKCDFPGIEIKELSLDCLEIHNQISPLMKNIARSTILHFSHWQNRKIQISDSEVLKIHYSYSVTTFKFLINRIDDSCTSAKTDSLLNWKTSSLVSLNQKCESMHLSVFHVKIVLINPKGDILFLSKLHEKYVSLSENYDLPSMPKTTESLTFDDAKNILQSLSIFEYDVDFLTSWVSTPKKHEIVISPLAEYFLVYLRTQLPIRPQVKPRCFRFIPNLSLQKIFADRQELQEYLYALKMFQKLM